MHSFDTLLRHARRAMRIVAGVCLMGMALLTGSDVVGRSLAKPIFGTEELVAILAVIAVAFTLPYAHVQESHIGVEIFIRRFPRHVRRALRLFTDLLCLGLFAVVTWRMALYGQTMMRSGVVSMNLELPEYMVVFVLAFGFLVFTLHVLRDVLAFFVKPMGEPAREAR